jgi:hypothetical protein
MKFLAPSILLLLFVATASAQDVPEDWPEAAAADVESVDSIVAAVYDVISGPAGPRDWDRFRSLFRPDGKLIPIGQGGSPIYWSVGDYQAQAANWFNEQAFFEKELARKTETYGPMVHLFSTYESYNAEDAEEPFARGINSFQLAHDGSRWWVVNIFWLGESEAHPIPAEYLPRD